MAAFSQVLNGVTRKQPIIGETTDIVVDIPVGYIGQLFLDKLLRHYLHFWDMIGCPGIAMRRQNVQLIPIPEIFLSIVLGYLISGASCSTCLVL